MTTKVQISGINYDFSALATLTGNQTLTGKSISGLTNTFTNVPLGTEQILSISAAGTTMVVGKTYNVDTATGAVAFSALMPTVANCVVGSTIQLINKNLGWKLYNFTAMCPNANVRFIAPSGNTFSLQDSLICDINIGGLTLKCVTNDGTNAYWEFI